MHKDYKADKPISFKIGFYFLSHSSPMGIPDMCSVCSGICGGCGCDDGEGRPDEDFRQYIPRPSFVYAEGFFSADEEGFFSADEEGPSFADEEGHVKSEDPSIECMQE